MFKIVQTSKKTGARSDVMTYKSYDKALAHLAYIEAKPFLTKYTEFTLTLA